MNWGRRYKINWSPEAKKFLAVIIILFIVVASIIIVIFSLEIEGRVWFALLICIPGGLYYLWTLMYTEEIDRSKE